MHRRLLVALLLLLWLAACGGESKGEILQKAEAAKTKQELRAALGDPDEVSKLGPIETWSYDASDGRVEFLITGDKVALETTSGEND